MRRRYNLGYTFKDTEDEAKEFCKYENQTGTYYKRKNLRAHYAEWSALDGSYDGFVCFYYY